MTIGAGYGTVQMSDGYDEQGNPVILSLEQDRLWLVARGQRLDVTDQVDEKTPYVDTWWDEEDTLHYVIVGGTTEDYGWFEGIKLADGSGGEQVFRTAVQTFRRMQRTRVAHPGPSAAPGPLGRTERAERIGMCLAVPRKLW